MSVLTRYMGLTIACDGSRCNSIGVKPTDSLTVKGPTEESLLKQVASSGWLMRKDGRVLCPKCRPARKG